MRLNTVFILFADFDSKKGCLDDVGFDLLLFRCAASKFPSVYGIDKSSQHSNICRYTKMSLLLD